MGVCGGVERRRRTIRRELSLNRCAGAPTKNDFFMKHYCRLCRFPLVELRNSARICQRRFVMSRPASNGPLAACKCVQKMVLRILPDFASVVFRETAPQVCSRNQLII